MRWAGHVARIQEDSNVGVFSKYLTGKPTGKRPLGRPRRRWEDTIRMDLTGISINTRNWIDPAQYRNYWRDLIHTAGFH